MDMKIKLEEIIQSLKQLAKDKKPVEFKDRNGNVYAIAEFYEDEDHFEDGSYNIEYSVVPIRETEEMMESTYYEMGDMEDAAIEIYQSEQMSVDEQGTIQYLQHLKEEAGKFFRFTRIDQNFVLATYDNKLNGWLLLKGADQLFEDNIQKAAKIIMRYRNETNIIKICDIPNGI